MVSDPAGTKIVMVQVRTVIFVAEAVEQFDENVLTSL
jgi:hypothetical protein